ncbi:MAG: hypothetical protein K9G59_03565 [Caulobacter sp.]|nr:hypothetical protein [Caulobacter sp.]
MTHSGPFWMARLKVQRAGDLIEQVQAELERCRNNPPIEFSVNQDENGQWSSSAKIGVFTIQVAPIVGDVIHNLRASLDLMASELARANGASDKNVYFPFAASEQELGVQIRNKNFDRAGPDAVALLQTFAPYRGGNLALRGIHDFDVEDKHSAIIPMAPYVELAFGTGFDADGAFDPALLTVRAVSDGLNFVFPKNGPFGGDEVVPTLEELVELVDGIIDAFAALAAARPAIS